MNENRSHRSIDALRGLILFSLILLILRVVLLLATLDPEEEKVIEVFEYELDRDRGVAEVVRRRPVQGRKLFTEEKGYREVCLASIADLDGFMRRIDDVTYAATNGHRLTVGGRKLQSRSPRTIRTEDVAAIWQAGPVRVRRIVLVVSLSVLAVVFHAIRYDGALISLVACNQLYRHKQWDALLDQAGHNAHADPRVHFMTNFALCQKRRLLHEMFRYDQVWGSRGLVFHFSDIGLHLF